MNRKAHIAIGVITTGVVCTMLNIKAPGVMQHLISNVPAISFNIGDKAISSALISSMIDNAVIAIIASPAPDIDLKLPGIGHRTWTHGLLILAISTGLICILNRQVAAVWAIAYLSHLLADSLTVMGVPFLYPFSKKKYGLKII